MQMYRGHHCHVRGHERPGWQSRPRMPGAGPPTAWWVSNARQANPRTSFFNPFVERPCFSSCSLSSATLSLPTLMDVVAMVDVTTATTKRCPAPSLQAIRVVELARPWFAPSSLLAADLRSHPSAFLFAIVQSIPSHNGARSTTAEPAGRAATAGSHHITAQRRIRSSASPHVAREAHLDSWPRTTVRLGVREPQPVADEPPAFSQTYTVARRA